MKYLLIMPSIIVFVSILSSLKHEPSIEKLNATNNTARANFAPINKNTTKPKPKKKKKKSPKRLMQVKPLSPGLLCKTNINLYQIDKNKMHSNNRSIIF